MKNINSNVGSFAKVKLQAKRRSFLATQIRSICAIALVAVIGFSMAACGDSGGGNNQQTETYTGTSGGTTYTLKITENTARYTAQSGDAYVLTAGSKTSKGMVISFENGILTLIPSNAPTAQFTVAVSENRITAINNTITWTDNTTADAPGAFTGGGNLPGGNSGDWKVVDVSDIFGSGILDGPRAIAYGNGKFVAVGYNGKMAYSSDNGVTWKAVADSKFGTSSIEAIAFGNGKFVAGGDNRKIANSTDGVNWELISDEMINTDAIAYGNNMFVIGGSYCLIMASTDGVNWEESESTPFSFSGYSYIKTIAYGNGKFVAGSTDSSKDRKMAYSTDGITWEAINQNIFDGYGHDIDAIVYGNGKFVASSIREMAYSTDGITWKAIDNLGYVAIAYGGGKFVAGFGGTIAYSSDGIKWTEVEDSIFGQGYDKGSISAITFGNGTFVAGSSYGKIAYFSEGSGGSGGGNTPQTATYTGATGGTTYTLKITENTARYAAQNGDAYELTAGSKKSTGTVSGVSGGSLTLKPNNKPTTTFTATVSGSSLTALNGTITWTDDTTVAAPGAFSGGSGGGTMKWTDITYTTTAFEYYDDYDDETYTADILAIAYGNGKFVAVGDNSKIATSADGINWTPVTDSPFGTISSYNTIWAIAYGNGKFVAGGTSAIAYSSDGVTWTTVTDDIFNNYKQYYVEAIAFGNGMFVAGNLMGQMAYSTDGVKWTAVADSKLSAMIRAIAYGNGKFVACDNDGGMAISTDGATWTAVNTGTIFEQLGVYGNTIGNIRTIAYGNNKFIATGGVGKMAYSTDGVTWTDKTDSKIGYSDAIVYGNGKFVADNGVTSTDGITWTDIEGFPSYVYALAYGNGTFVAVGRDGRVAYSTGN
jgi:hypothetical protein